MEGLQIEKGYKHEEVRLQLADILRTSERESYTFIALLSDFGGFNDGISLLPAYIMTLYNTRLFRAAKAQIFSYKSKSRSKGKNKLQKKFASEQSLGKTLQNDDVQCLSEETSLVQFSKISCLRSLCFSPTFCRRDRRLRLH